MKYAKHFWEKYKLLHHLSFIYFLKIATWTSRKDHNQLFPFLKMNQLNLIKCSKISNVLCLSSFYNKKIWKEVELIDCEENVEKSNYWNHKNNLFQFNKEGSREEKFGFGYLFVKEFHFILGFPQGESGIPWTHIWS